MKFISAFFTLYLSISQILSADSETWILFSIEDKKEIRVLALRNNMKGIMLDKINGEVEVIRELTKNTKDVTGYLFCEYNLNEKKTTAYYKINGGFLYHNRNKIRTSDFLIYIKKNGTKKVIEETRKYLEKKKQNE